MGEWSDYFEDFPEENPANWVHGRFYPNGPPPPTEHDLKVEREAAQIRAEKARLTQMQGRPSKNSNTSNK